ncbi:hypothetical protein [Pseudoalteromonas prydzensis]|uniref:hypothetical protein n=1 Tax=Pseudoalteromonas prydzensis TaxID=182141 RepID=UPI000A6DD7AA|nr:hypothetical protein [Pseudoalteromonas prydzensis]MBE0376127.1 hypothetical protein [Pseudoalteromonas prydzensis ACAM 620]
MQSVQAFLACFSEVFCYFQLAGRRLSLTHAGQTLLVLLLAVALVAEDHQRQLLQQYRLRGVLAASHNVLPGW